MPHSRRLDRRTIVLGALALPLAGCGIRLERDAPDLPGVPKQQPPADTVVMQQAIARLRSVTAAFGSSSGNPWHAPLRTLHTAQADALVRIAAGEGIPATPTTSATTTPTTSAASSPAHTSPERAEQAGLSATWLSSVTAAGRSNRPALIAIAAGNQAGTRLLKTSGLAPGTGLSAAAAGTVLVALRPAIYAAEQLIAKTKPSARTSLSGLLTSLYAERSRLVLEAGSAAPPEQLSFNLPAGSDDPARAKATLGPMLASVRQAVASQVGQAQTRQQVTRTVQVWGDVTALTWQWGVTPPTFLGLKFTENPQ